MRDSNQRNITYLRISVTDKCNLRCTYCMPEEGVMPMHHDEIMTIEETILAAKTAAELGVKKIRITGGEPLVRKGILTLCQGISQISSIDEICMTTNGTLLPQFAKELRKAGVHRLNISLDTLNPDKYHQITRTGQLQDVLDGICAAKSAGFSQLKINVVLMAGFNDDEIQDFVALTKEEPIDVRFIELMPIGSGVDNGEYISCERVLEVVPNLVPLNQTDGVAELFKMPGSIGNIGLIRGISCKFCDHCNKIRLTADGKIKPCLHSHLELPIKGLTSVEMRQVMEQAIDQKPIDRGNLDHSHPSCAGRSMSQIGG